MPLRFGVPLTIVLMLLASAASSALGLDVYAALTLATAGLAAFDAHPGLVRAVRHPVRGPPGRAGPGHGARLASGVSRLLRLRHRIRTGELQVGAPPPRGRRAVVGAVAALAAFGAIGVAGWHLTRDLRPVVRALDAEVGLPTNVNLSNGSNLVLRIPEGAVPAEGREELARRIAEVAYASYPRPAKLNSVRVVFLSIQRDGAVTRTSREAEFRFWAEDLQQSSAPAA